ncbi:MAG: DUF6293 family protein [Thermoplasmata archaeon]
MEEITHIAPLGFERDRVVAPFRKYPVTRVHLLTVASERHGHELYEQQALFTDLVVGDLEELGIEVHVHDVNIFDVLETMRKTSEVIRLELARGARVYVNMSAAGRLTSVACSLAGMYQGVQVYYVKATRYSSSKEEKREHGISVCEDVVLVRLQNFYFERPKPLQCGVLKQLNGRGEMRTEELLEVLGEDFDDFSEGKRYRRLPRRRKQVLLMRLNRRVLDPLEERGHITRKREGRYSRVSISESGRYLASIC